MFCGINNYNTCLSAVFRHWHSLTIVLLLVYCPADDKPSLFEVGPKIRCSDVSRRHCCYGNRTAGPKPV